MGDALPTLDDLARSIALKQSALADMIRREGILREELQALYVQQRTLQATGSGLPLRRPCI